MPADGKTPPEKLWLVLARCYKSVSERAREHIESCGLGLSDFAVLEALLHKGPLSVSALGTKVLLTSGSMTAAVNRLARKGFVTRRANSQDKRVQEVHLTPKGRKEIEPIFASHMRAIAEAVSALSAVERDQLARLLKKLGHGAQNVHANQHGGSEIVRNNR